MHRCSVKCCENTSAGLDETQNCLERCSIPVNKAQTYLHKELQMFQVSITFMSQNHYQHDQPRKSENSRTECFSLFCAPSD